MGVAQEVLQELHESAAKQDYLETARQLRRSMQAWGVSYGPADTLLNEDTTLIARFWHALYSLPESEIRKEAVRLYALFLAADMEWAFTPLTVMANAECERIHTASGELLAELNSIRKVVPLRSGAPKLSVITNTSLAPK